MLSLICPLGKWLLFCFCFKSAFLFYSVDNKSSGRLGLSGRALSVWTAPGGMFSPTKANESQGTQGLLHITLFLLQKSALRRAGGQWKKRPFEVSGGWRRFHIVLAVWKRRLSEGPGAALLPTATQVSLSRLKHTGASGYGVGSVHLLSMNTNKISSTWALSHYNIIQLFIFMTVHVLPRGLLRVNF